MQLSVVSDQVSAMGIILVLWLAVGRHGTGFVSKLYQNTPSYWSVV